MTPCPLVRDSIYYIGIFLLLYTCIYDWIICGAANDTTYRPLNPNELRAFLTELQEKNTTQWHKCPAPKLLVTDKECKAKGCRNDKDCNNQVCCFNGCVFTCVQEMSPPAVIDWVEEPDMSSLVSSDNEMRPCAISPRPAPSLPVGCPRGFVCRVQNPDEDDNMGLCVPDVHTEAHSDDDEDSLFKEHTGKNTVYLPGGCVLTAEQYEHMRKFMLRSYVVDCFCIKGSVECQVTL